MKTLPDLKNIDTLERLKTHLSEAVDREIERRKIDERVNSIDTMSLGQLKTIFESLGSELFNENKNLIGRYVKTIKENKSLRTLYALYESTVNPLHTKNSASLLDTMIKLSESLSADDINSGKEELRKIVKEAVIASNVSSEEFDSIVGENKELNESIDYIFGTKVNSKNLFEYTNKKDYVEKYINENMKSEEAVSESINTEEALNQYNKLFEGLEPWESEVVKDLSLCQLSESTGEDLFNRYKDECLSILSEKIEEAESIEEKSRLSLMKEQLSEKKFNAEKLEENLLKLADLKHTLQD